MDSYIIRGGRPLRGITRVQGSKNSCLPIMAAALATGAQVVLHSCPDLTDVASMARILVYLGCRVKREGSTLTIDTAPAAYRPLPEDLMGGLRSSSIFMGAMLARFGRVQLCYPGGCALGRRPLDYHLSGFEALGAVSDYDQKQISLEGRHLQGTDIFLPYPSVGATQNLLIAAVSADGQTVLHGAAREPEVVDLIQFLTACGAGIQGMGTDTVTVSGGGGLHGCEYRIMPDRIAAVTLLCMGLITGGQVTLQGITPMGLYNVLPLLKKMGAQLDLRYDRVGVSPSTIRGPGLICTAPHPGVPTDIQPLLCTLLATARGTTTVVDTVFENRFVYVRQLEKLGAAIQLPHPQVAYIEGGSRYRPASVRATDLRGGAAVCMAALAAPGESKITDIDHILRGYEDLDGQVSALGGEMKRV
ncbi:UDP-N-acetylglucosamine 1-carboxyvinyltransferase [Neobittarella massiliensis]|uniref:UDP-N-acetylglucosamine 1-carboxyvinyltransferase n=1 Tax=uncultured Anaerotruncus sp. TaxID=905011 RepID=A0A1C6K631_9FIRM|nr:UDP-N-acetylglucosamine 1-carboxyvinyltransferase [Neobittarella massiliensis]SCJ89794.1 UDP-N-acetylglucosamine 1-carboxyvinyltransferase 1 [uncultured Anaerotruncus sp.]